MEAKRKLLKNCLKFCKEQNYKFIWTCYGVIYLRCNKHTPASRITSVGDLERLQPRRPTSESTSLKQLPKYLPCQAKAKVTVFFVVLVYVFSFSLFEFSAAILKKGRIKTEFKPSIQRNFNDIAMVQLNETHKMDQIQSVIFKSGAFYSRQTNTVSHSIA